MVFLQGQKKTLQETTHTLNTIFMNQKTEINIWQEFTKETGGAFKKGHSSISDSTTIEYKNWTITFDNFTIWSGKYSSEMTRVVTPITFASPFRFEIYREGFLRKIENFLGAQDIKIGHPQFDKAFTIKSDNEFKVKTLLRNKEIRNKIESQKDVNILISDQKGIWEEKLTEGNYELSYYTDGKINDLEILKSLVTLFKIILDELYQMNSIH
ncbi:hypothetical protein AB674_07975 [Flavobacterium sp. ABG]|nr:hypothetical protein AB674_07975 [Flavobacterium sp. ABG]